MMITSYMGARVSLKLPRLQYFHGTVTNCPVSNLGEACSARPKMMPGTAPDSVPEPPSYLTTNSITPCHSDPVMVGDIAFATWW